MTRNTRSYLVGAILGLGVAAVVGIVFFLNGSEPDAAQPAVVADSNVEEEEASVDVEEQPQLSPGWHVQPPADDDDSCATGNIMFQPEQGPAVERAQYRGEVEVYEAEGQFAVVASCEDSGVEVFVALRPSVLLSSAFSAAMLDTFGWHNDTFLGYVDIIGDGRVTLWNHLRETQIDIPWVPVEAGPSVVPENWVKEGTGWFDPLTGSSLEVRFETASEVELPGIAIEVPFFAGD